MKSGCWDRVDAVKEARAMTAAPAPQAPRGPPYKPHSSSVHSTGERGEHVIWLTATPHQPRPATNVRAAIGHIRSHAKDVIAKELDLDETRPWSLIDGEICSGPGWVSH